MKTKTTLILLAAATLLLANACKDGARGKTLLPGVTGKSGEVIVVMDKSVESSALGQALLGVLREDYPMLPQIEPLFNAHPIPYAAFSDLFKVHRNIILVKVSSEFAETKMLRQNDIWASPQTVLNVVGNNTDSMAAYVKKHGDILVATFERAELARNVSNIKKYEEKRLRDVVKKKLGVSLYFPRGYTLRREAENFLWISYETESTSQGVFVYAYPYDKATLPDRALMVSKRNEFLKSFVPGTLKGSYMVTVTDVEPLRSVEKFNGFTFATLRGLWDVQGDFMGGPFICYTLLDEANARCLVMEAYVYAPKSDKRIYLRQTDAVLRTVEK